MGSRKRMQKSIPNSFRNLEKANLGGVIFGCTDETINECLSKQLFGLPAPHFVYVKNIDPGLPLFLLNYSRRELHGIYEAASPGQLNINPYGWTRDGSERTGFPSQVRIRTLKNSCPLFENQFSPVIKGNYFTERHFRFELDHVQANKLLALFSTQVAAPSSSVIRSTTKSKILNTRPPRLQCGERNGTVSLHQPASSFYNELNEPSSLADPSTRNDEMLLRDDMGANVKNEMELTYEKLQKLAVNSKPSNFILETQVHEFSNTNAMHFEAGGSRETQITDRDNAKGNSPLLSDYPSIIAQLMIDVRELNTYKKESIEKIEQLERKLHILESKVLLSEGHDDKTMAPLPGNSEIRATGTMTESCSDQPLDLNGSIFLAGGYDGKSWLASLESYHPSKDIIKSLRPMSSTRSYASLARLNDDIYVIGGGPGGPDGLWYDTVEYYNPVCNEWTSLACLSEKKGSLAAVTLHDKIFALGGGNGVRSFSDVEMFDLDVGRWISSRSMLQKRFALAAVELNGALYAVGGFDEKDYLSSAERFDPREHSWSRLGSMNTKRGCHAMVVLNEKLYAVGGFDGSSMVGSVEVLDPRFGTWNMDASLNYQRGYCAAAVVNNSIYAIGGLDESQNIIDKVERYEEGCGWQVTDLKAIGKRCFASAI